MTERTALYRHFDKEGTLLYVGISLSALNRLAQHAVHSGWYKEITRVEMEWFDTRETAMEAERNAIYNENPKHNLKGKRAPSPAERETSLDAERITYRLVTLHPTYTLDEAAQVLSCSGATVSKLIDANELGCIKRSNRRKLVSGWQLLDFIERAGGIPKPQRRAW